MPPRGKWVCTGNGTHRQRELFPERVVLKGDPGSGPRTFVYHCPTCGRALRIRADRALVEIRNAVDTGTYKVDISLLT